MIEQNIQPPAIPTRELSAPPPTTTNKPFILAKQSVKRCVDCGKELVDGDCPDCNKVIRL